MFSRLGKGKLKRSIRTMTVVSPSGTGLGRGSRAPPVPKERLHVTEDPRSSLSPCLHNAVQMPSNAVITMAAQILPPSL